MEGNNITGQSGFRHGSLFSGIGGFDLAAQWMGWENKFHCEWNEFGQKVLKYYWPAAESFSDITKTDFSKYKNRIDVISGGFPCQPYSTAGKRLGKEDERHLWPEMLRAIREISPRWVVGENVRGLTNWNGGLVFDEVQADLEAEGYEVLPFLLPACAVNAPHRRDRIWIVAYRDNGQRKHEEGEIQAGRDAISGVYRDATNPGCKPGNRRQGDQPGQSIHNRPDGGRNEAANKPERLREAGPNTDTGGIGSKRGQISGDQTNREWEGNTEKFFTGCNDRNMRTGWEIWPTVTPLCTGNDGLSARLDTATISFPKWRTESIKAAGNAIVPPR